MSPEWRALTAHALSEASRLRLTISMEGCDGWSESGGPWVPASESMQKVVWTERQVGGGRKVALALPQPETVLNYYEDIAVYAFPALARARGDSLAEPADWGPEAAGSETHHVGQYLAIQLGLAAAALRPAGAGDGDTGAGGFHFIRGLTRINADLKVGLRALDSLRALIGQNWPFKEIRG
jgi:hypothetical protein